LFAANEDFVVDGKMTPNGSLAAAGDSAPNGLLAAHGNGTPNRSPAIFSSPGISFSDTFFFFPMVNFFPFRSAYLCQGKYFQTNAIVCAAIMDMDHFYGYFSTHLNFQREAKLSILQSAKRKLHSEHI
jgi:hypothetical protein